MKESTLLKMKHDLELTQKAVVVALNRIEQLEKEKMEKIKSEKLEQINKLKEELEKLEN